ncbi:ferrous iron transport protein B [Ferviditalea candida]|uniref:Ferrous iron transport protein B n=1 Tax=Ferviditalea candida TaxID=3108399 RepID=A0ABU5ZGR7_9BACL|nr:ferrous iron transport protein B [Paenibacillaceae bacterium T2]
MIQVALFGNPNTGKTSLFNKLTGSYEYVGNWSGVTVEKKVGTLRSRKGTLIDLPGIYSLNPLSLDESVPVNFLLEESFTSILNIVDASKLARNLHLTIQLLEYGQPVVLALNMTDVARSRGFHIDEKALSAQLGVPVFPIVARKGEGCDELGGWVAREDRSRHPSLVIDYGVELEEAIRQLISRLPAIGRLNPRWLALRFFEGNSSVVKLLEKYVEHDFLRRLIQDTEQNIFAANPAKSLSRYIHDVRQAHIQRMIEQAVVIEKKAGRLLTDSIDAVVTNRFLGIPVFLLVMFLIFKFTFDWLGSPAVDVLDAFFSGRLTAVLEKLLNAMGAGAFVKDLILNGIVAGVGGIVVFVPQIMILFFFISFIEDSGYMARVAVVMDRAMQAVGLNGKAFIPMIIGFGCNVPGVMAARTIEQHKERLLTILLTPLMSCSARLSIYSLFVAAFFAEHQGLIVFSLYMLGILVAFIVAKILSTTMLKNESSMFLVELPPYRLPQLSILLRSTWDKGKGFVKKAGTLIFGGSVIIWLLANTGPGGFNVGIDESFLALFGGILAPLLTPLGFGTWQAGSAFVSGFLAKEAVVSTMNIIYFVPDTNSLRGLITEFFSPLQAYSFLVFTLLYIPCLSTVAVISKESGSRRWAAFSIIYSLAAAYAVSLLIYQGGRLLGFH